MSCRRARSTGCVGTGIRTVGAGPALSVLSAVDALGQNHLFAPPSAWPSSDALSCPFIP